MSNIGFRGIKPFLLAAIGVATIAGLYASFWDAPIGLRVTLMLCPEPQYQGTNLSHWLAIAGNSHTPGLAQILKPGGLKPITYNDNFLYCEKPVTNLNGVAREAIRAIGINAIPTLLVMVQTKGKSSIKEDLTPTDAAQRRMHAFWGFMALGSMAAPAIPALEKLTSSSDREVAIKAVWCLGAIGPEAVPALRRASTNTIAAISQTAKKALSTNMTVWVVPPGYQFKNQ
jgi:hypothetical protein